MQRIPLDTSAALPARQLVRGSIYQPNSVFKNQFRAVAQLPTGTGPGALPAMR